MGNGGSGHQFAIGDLNNTNSYILLYSFDIWIQNTKSRLARLLSPKETWTLPEDFALNWVLYHTFLPSVYTQRVFKHTPCYLTYRKNLYFWIKRLSCPNIHKMEERNMLQCSGSSMECQDYVNSREIWGLSIPDAGNCSEIHTSSYKSQHVCKMECITWTKCHQGCDLKMAETFASWILSKRWTACDSCKRLWFLLLVNKMIVLHCDECDVHTDRDAVCIHTPRNIQQTTSVY